MTRGAGRPAALLSLLGLERAASSWEAWGGLGGRAGLGGATCSWLGLRAAVLPCPPSAVPRLCQLRSGGQVVRVRGWCRRGGVEWAVLPS
jgi:hypothetical protein